MKRPIDTRTSEPIEPKQIFDVTLEPDQFTEEKYTTSGASSQCELILLIDINFLRIISGSSIEKAHLKLHDMGSKGFSVLDLNELHVW